MSKLQEVLVGDTFKARFIASGTTPSVIIHTLFDGDENIVSSGTGTNSGNGHYYRNTIVNSPGYYVSQWEATITGNPHKRRRRIKAILGEVD